MKRTVLFVTIVLASGVLFTNVYNSAIDARAWGSDIPRSIDTVRRYYADVNPGDFHRIVTPLVQLLSVLALVLHRRAPRLRWLLAGAVASFAVTDVLTYAYFYPRNHFMFEQGALTDVAGLTRAWSEWSDVNWIRSALFALGVALSCLAAHRSYERAAAWSPSTVRRSPTRTGPAATTFA